jgi:hypothetical protein
LVAGWGWQGARGTGARDKPPSHLGEKAVGTGRFRRARADGGRDAQGRIEGRAGDYSARGGARGRARLSRILAALHSRFGDGSAHLEASAAGGPGLHVEIERSLEQGAKVHAGLRGVELAVAKSRPMAERQDVRRDDLDRVTLRGKVLCKDRGPRRGAAARTASPPTSIRRGVARPSPRASTRTARRRPRRDGRGPRRATAAPASPSPGGMRRPDLAARRWSRGCRR